MFQCVTNRLPTDGKMGFLTRLFGAHGHLCASRPWEVIIGTVTVTACMMSMSLFATANSKICGWNYRCEQPADDDTKSSDVIILTITRCLAVIYFYMQFKNLRRLGSKYLLGIAGLFTIFSSFVFSIGVVNIFGTDLTGLNEALPFFLLLVDLSKACTLAKFALSSTTQDEVVDNIGRGMALLGPVLTLDAVVETLVIAIGTMSGVKVLQTMCCFGCLSIIANYFAFMTFYPACLALILELSRGTRPLQQIQQLAKAWDLAAEEEKPNPVTQRVKIIMSAGLLMVHVHRRFAVSGVAVAESFADTNTSHIVPPELTRSMIPDIPLWQFYLRQVTSLSLDYILTLVLAAVLTVKYVVFDCDGEEGPPDRTAALVVPGANGSVKQNAESPPLVPLEDTEDHSGSAASNVVPADTIAGKPVFAVVSTETQTEQPSEKPRMFTVGDDSSDESGNDEGTDMVSEETQTEESPTGEPVEIGPPRPLQECMDILKSEDGASRLTDDEVLALVAGKQIAAYQLETVLADHLRGVTIRRRLVAKSLPSESAIEKLPYANYEYKYVHGSCCENVVGYVPVPVGVVGPLLLDGKQYTVPMATTEGCLLASTNRGCRAFVMSGGVVSLITKDGMTRAPVVRFSCARRANEAKQWIETEENYRMLSEAFNNTSRFARVSSIKVKQVARSLHLRFTAFTGDAMGMNMVSKGCEKSLKIMKEYFPDMEVLSLSGNFCTDKKSSAVNWIEGRGKSVVCDAVVPARVVHDVLKTSASALVDLNVEKNLMGSAIAGSLGGFNAHAANVVTAIYIATGQDPAQNVCSSNCLTVMESTGPMGEDLYISCTMPCIEVGTIGGGTVLPPQTACLEMLGVRGSNVAEPGANAQTLARIICATVMAAELSLMSALTTGDLVKSHLRHNRSVLNMAPTPNSSLFSADSGKSHTSLFTTDFGKTAGTCLKS